MSIPQERRYGDTHEWYRIEDGVMTIGVTEPGQDLLGDVVYADLPEVGQQVEKGAPCATLESVKAASDVACPADGEVIAINEKLEDEPELINDDPFEAGWLLQLRIEGEPEEWMSPEAYQQKLDFEG